MDDTVVTPSVESLVESVIQGQIIVAKMRSVFSSLRKCVRSLVRYFLNYTVTV
jgi:hypothetical protein